LVRRGAGFAVVDEFTARASLSDDFDFRPLTGSASFSVYCIHLEDRPLSRIAREFLAVLKSALEGTRS
jgi:DNA-binding transcriptional LysR family regulator